MSSLFDSQIPWLRGIRAARDIRLTEMTSFHPKTIVLQIQTHETKQLHMIGPVMLWAHLFQDFSVFSFALHIVTHSLVVLRKHQFFKNKWETF